MIYEKNSTPSALPAAAPGRDRLMTVMPFGKYCGLALPDLPDLYLYWLLFGGEIVLREPLRSEALREYHRRGYTVREPATPPATPARGDAAWADALIAAGLKALAKRHHPDVGGHGPDMAQINHAADWLRAKVERGPLGASRPGR